MFDGVIPGARVIGMPLSRDIVELDRLRSRIEAREFFSLPQTGPVLLVFGGSQGAQSLNSACVAALPELLSAGVNVIHSVGGANFQPGSEITDSSGACYIPVPFIHRMDLAYSAADLVIARAGAMTVAEISTVGIPTIFVPLPIGNGEQKRNAQNLIDNGAAAMIENSVFTREVIVSELLPLLLNAPELERMQAAFNAGDSLNAAEELARWGLSCS
jgi:UDP-N-acetylglucosamine--N-acetylmuramyl-(pentapeptide) pyrophosphoryl-undecaprenol N-acetylglucosamine transferase